jgi:hypothetical protein
MKYLVDLHYPDPAWVTVIHDQLNTHVPSALYKTFKPEEARMTPVSWEKLLMRCHRITLGDYYDRFIYHNSCGQNGTRSFAAEPLASDVANRSGSPVVAPL